MDNSSVTSAFKTRYIRSGDVNIAYQVVGNGPVDLLWIPVFAQHLELSWEEPNRRAWLTALAAEYRLIVFDKRGTGLSDRFTGAPTVEVRMDDCRAVLDAARSEHAVVLTSGDASYLALVLAATYPSRVRAVALWDAQYRGTWAPDYPWAPPREEALRTIEEMERNWPRSLFESMQRTAPSLSGTVLEDFVRVTRLSVSPGSAAAYRPRDARCRRARDPALRARAGGDHGEDRYAGRGRRALGGVATPCRGVRRD